MVHDACIAWSPIYPSPDWFTNCITFCCNIIYVYLIHHPRPACAMMSQLSCYWLKIPYNKNTAGEAQLMQGHPAFLRPGHPIPNELNFQSCALLQNKCLNTRWCCHKELNCHYMWNNHKGWPKSSPVPCAHRINNNGLNLPCDEAHKKCVLIPWGHANYKSSGNTSQGCLFVHNYIFETQLEFQQ